MTSIAAPTPLPGPIRPLAALRWRRIIPVVFLMYTISFMDRQNVATVLPFLNGSLHLSVDDKAKIMGAFFWGYFILQAPAGYLAIRWSARKLILILLLCWGVAAASCGLARSVGEFEIARFVLGLAEGGVAPAVWVLLRAWFPRGERARAFSYWLLCLPVASAVTAPITGTLLHFCGWRETFFLEAAPAFLWMAVWWFGVADTPEQASWLPESERNDLRRQFAAEAATDDRVTPDNRLKANLRAMADFRVWMLVAIYLSWITVLFGISLWIPEAVKSLGVQGSVAVGLLTSTPYLVAVGLMMACSRASDRTGRRMIFIAMPQAIFALVVLAAGRPGLPGALVFLLLVAATAMTFAPFGPFWATPGDLLPAAAAGVAIGIINGVGNLGGTLGSWLVAQAAHHGRVTVASFWPLALSAVVAAGLAMALGQMTKKR